MHVSTLNQLIDTGGLLLVTLAALLSAKSLMKRQRTADFEEILVKDLLYMHSLVDLQARMLRENGVENFTSRLNRAAEQDCGGWKRSEVSQKARLELRLRQIRRRKEIIASAKGFLGI